MLAAIFFGLSIQCLMSMGFLTVHAQITKTSFSCEGRVSGYYADVGTGCQVYHMCDGLGRKFSFACPNATLFQQRMLICDHWFMVNCSKSESEYSANLLIGQKGKPFVGDSGQTSFQRTPRPDYASGDAEKNSAIFHNNVDPAEDSNNSIGLTTGESNYNLPSRWSTEYNKETVPPTADPKDQILRRQDSETTNRLSIKFNADETSSEQQVTKNVVVNFESHFKATTPVYPQFVDEALKLNDLDLAPPKTQTFGVGQYQEVTDTSVHVNFESHYKATTPVYPKFVDDALKQNDADLSPPSPSPSSSPKQNSSKPVEIHVNFPSDFKATTPVYPTFVEDAMKINNLELFPPLGEDAKIKVNFVSNFEATTPVYPLTVDSTSPIPEDIGLLPPFEDLKVHQVETTTGLPVNFDSNFLATRPNYPQSVEATSPLPEDVGLLPPRIDPTARSLSFEPKNDSGQNGEEPSQYYEPPLFNTGYVDPNGALAGYNPNSKHVLPPEIADWNALRRRFSVPDYDFPLDSGAHRASYDSELNSFQPRAAGSQKR